MDQTHGEAVAPEETERLCTRDLFTSLVLTGEPLSKVQDWDHTPNIFFLSVSVVVFSFLCFTLPHYVALTVHFQPDFLKSYILSTFL